MFFIDTNIIIYALKGDEHLKESFLKLNPADIKIPSIVKAELLYGANKSSNPEKAIKAVYQFLFPFDLVDFDDKATIIYGNIRAQLDTTKQKKEIINNNDIFIASIVMANEGILITNDQKDFSRISGLKTENWLSEETDT